MLHHSKVVFKPLLPQNNPSCKGCHDRPHLLYAAWFWTKHFERNGRGNVENINLKTFTSDSFCPDHHKLFLTMRTRPFIILLELGTLLTTMHKQCFDSVWMEIPLSLQQKLHSKQQIIVDIWAKIQRKLPCIFEGITTLAESSVTSIYGINFNSTCSPRYTKWFRQLLHKIGLPGLSHHPQIWQGTGFFSQDITIFSI